MGLRVVLGVVLYSTVDQVMILNFQVEVSILTCDVEPANLRRRLGLSRGVSIRLLLDVYRLLLDGHQRLV